MSDISESSVPWLRRLSPPRADAAEDSLRLVCFPFAGGSASAYWPIVGHVPAHVAVYAVQLPGRHELAQATPVTDWRAAVRALSTEIAAMAGDSRLAFFGHSMGAMLAFETAHELRALGLPGPGLLAVSGAAAPDRRGQGRDVRHDLDDLD